MSYPINYPTPQGANIQIFTDRTRNLAAATSFNWTKPQGASFVWFTLIGAGGNGNGTPPSAFGGGSGAVTNFMCPAFLIPDSLVISLPQPNSSSSTKVRYQQKASTPYDLLTANNGQDAAAGTAMTANAFTAMGFFQSIAGQDGGAYTVGQTASATTFLSGGAGATVTSNYGYSTGINNAGYFQMQPIIVGVAGGGGNGIGGIGCGGGYTAGVSGGNGMVVIITW